MAIDKRNPELPPPSPAIKQLKQTIQIDHGDTHTQLILPLRDRFETVGSLVVGLSVEPCGSATRFVGAHAGLLIQ